MNGSQGCGDSGSLASNDAGDDGGGDAGSLQGSDAGADGGTDAGTRFDAGTDAGIRFDGGADAGPGFDGGTDAGPGFDAGADAGPGFDSGVDAGTGFDGGSDAGCVPPPAGIIGWWNGDAIYGATAQDIFAGHDGLMSGAVLLDPGEVGNAFDFGTGGGIVEVADAPELSATSALTVEAWVYPTDFFRAFQRIVSKQMDNQTNSTFVLGLGTRGGIYFGCYKNGAQTYVDGANPLTLNAWNHIAGVWDGVSMRVYLNGVMQPETGFIAAPLSKSTVPLRLGRGDTSNYLFSGKTDEVTLYDRALSQKELAAIVAAGSAGKCKPPPFDAGLDAGPGDAGLGISDAGIPRPTHEATAASDGKFVYLFGGLTDQNTFSDEISRYDPATDTLTLLPSVLPYGRQASGAVWTGQYIYLFGGRRDFTTLVDQIVRFDPATGSVAVMNAVLPTGRYNMGVVWSGELVYVIGGYDYTTLSEIITYDPATDTIGIAPALLPTGRQAPGAIWNGQDVYILGGADATTIVDQICRFNPPTGTVTVLSQRLPYPVLDAAIVWDGQHAYQLGGTGLGGVFFNTIVEFTPTDDSVSVLTPLLPHHESGRAAAWLGSQGYVFGGYNGDQGTFLDTILVFTPP